MKLSERVLEMRQQIVKAADFQGVTHINANGSAEHLKAIADEIAALEERAGVTLSEEAAIKRAIRVLTLVDTPVHEADQEDHAAADALCALLERTKAKGAVGVSAVPSPAVDSSASGSAPLPKDTVGDWLDDEPSGRPVKP